MFNRIFCVDQFGNIQKLSNNIQQSSNGVTASKENSAPTPPTPPDNPTVKKESRLKHFFSPIRKKTPVTPPPPVISQPADVYISNILPSNMYVNPLQVTASPPQAEPLKAIETSSPTSSFQVIRSFCCFRQQ